MTDQTSSDPLETLRRAIERVDAIESEMAKLAAELASAKASLVEAERSLSASPTPRPLPVIPQPTGFPSASDGSPSSADPSRSAQPSRRPFLDGSDSPLPIVPQPSGVFDASEASPKLGIFRSLARSLAAFAQSAPSDQSSSGPSSSPPKAPPKPPLAAEAKALVLEIRDDVKAARAFFVEAEEASERGHDSVAASEEGKGLGRLNEAARAASRLLSRADALAFGPSSRRRVFGLKVGLQMHSNNHVLPHSSLSADLVSCGLDGVDDAFSDADFREGLRDVLGASVVDRAGGPLNLYLASLLDSVSRYSGFGDNATVRANCARLVETAPEPLDPKVVGALAVHLEHDTWDLLAPLLRAGAAEAESREILDASAPASAPRSGRSSL